MSITDHAFMLGQYVIVAAFSIDPTILGVQVIPIAMAMMVTVAISAAVLLSSKHAQIRAMGPRMARLLKDAKRGWIPTSPSELNRKAPRGVIIAAGVAVFLFNAWMCWFAICTYEGCGTPASWELHTGLWGCVVGVFGIVWGIRKRRSRVSRRWDRPSNAIRKRLCREVTDTFQRNQQMLPPPFPSRIKAWHRHR